MIYLLTIFTLVLFIIVIAIVSEYKRTTFVYTVELVTITIYKWVKSVLSSNECYYPTGIGYDVNGIFCPGAVEKEFADLGQILNSYYLAYGFYYQ